MEHIRQKTRELGYEVDLIDKDFLSELQERFSDSNNVYCVCLDRNKNFITNGYGTEEEDAFIRGQIQKEKFYELVGRLDHDIIENVVEEKLVNENCKICAISVRVDNITEVVWVVFGVLDDIEGECVPSYMRSTSQDYYYKSIRLLEALSRHYFACKVDEAFALDAFLKSKEAQKRTEAELKRNEVMTSVVQKLADENGFSHLAEEILKEVCEYLDIAGASLIQITNDKTKADMICEWTQNGVEKHYEEFKALPIEKLPFLIEKPMVISSSSSLPEKIDSFFQKIGIKAGISFPIKVNSVVGMYMCFVETRHKRIWSIGDIKFLNDVKQILQSILARRIAKNSLASSYASLEAILENVGSAIIVKAPGSGKILYTNHRFHELFQAERDIKEFELLLEEQFDGKMHGKSNEVYSNVEDRYFDISYTQIRWVDGRNVMLCTVYDVTDKKLYQQKIERQANNDFLTGLYNRMRCEQDLYMHIEKTKKIGGQGALLYIDLDDFKHINDGLGHQYGDVLLKAISHSLQRINGIETTCYRMGGDEFIIIVTYDQFAGLEKILQDIREIFTRPWFLKGADYYCTMSMGIVQYPKDGDSVQELIKKADIALYEAKKSGKNRIEYYDDNVEATSFKRLDLEKNMRDATMDSFKEFEVYYQPIIDISKPGNPCSGAEALIRWNSQKMGFISPAEFIPLAEYLGLINPIGNYVLEEACRRCKEWNDAGYPDYRINVNLSVVQLLQNDTVEKIRNIIKETRIKPTNLTLEVTESLAINDMARMKRVLAQIKQLGVWVALDDFGTGYSSLNHIRELPIDVIKIDRCFVIDIGKDDYSEIFVKMVSELAETIGVRMCVEGVEEEEQLAKLRKMKVQYIQGFYYDRPLRIHEFEAKYINRNEE